MVANLTLVHASLTIQLATLDGGPQFNVPVPLTHMLAGLGDFMCGIVLMFLSAWLGGRQVENAVVI